MTSYRKIDKFKCPGGLLGGIFRSMTGGSLFFVFGFEGYFVEYGVELHGNFGPD